MQEVRCFIVLFLCFSVIKLVNSCNIFVYLLMIYSNKCDLIVTTSFIIQRFIHMSDFRVHLCIKQAWITSECSTRVLGIFMPRLKQQMFKTLPWHVNKASSSILYWFLVCWELLSRIQNWVSACWGIIEIYSRLSLVMPIKPHQVYCTGSWYAESFSQGFRTGSQHAEKV